MVARLHFPAGYAMISLHYSGIALPNGATCTIGCVADTNADTPSAVAARVKTALRKPNGPYAQSPAFHTNQVTLLDINVKFGPQDVGPEASVSDGQPLSGGAIATLQANSAYLVVKQSIIGGKRGKGRMFCPGLGENYTDGAGNLDPGALAALNASWKQFETDMVAGGNSLVVMHTYDTAKGQLPMVPTTVDTLNVSGLAATQRQRMRR